MYKLASAIADRFISGLINLYYVNRFIDAYN